MKWNLADVMNTVAFRPDRELVKRDYAWASELGMPYLDRFFQMNAVPYETPPNQRSLGKFLAGAIWQHTFEVILKVAGLYKDSEIRIDEKPYRNLIGVHGKCDILAGKFDKQLAFKNIEQIRMLIPEQLMYKVDGVLEALGDIDLDDKIMELKATSKYVVDKMIVMKQPLRTHGLQAYHYHRPTKIFSTVLAVSKDDSFMAEAEVTSDIYEDLYQQDLDRMTYYIKNGIVPPPDPPLWFNNLLGKFEKNIMVEYSKYLHSQGYQSPFDFRARVDPQITKWNNAIKRYVQVEFGITTDKGNKIKMTTGAEEAKKEIIAAGFDFDTIIEVKKRFIDVEEPENEEI